MAVDPAQRQIDERVRATPPAERMRLQVEMYRLAFAQVWAAADRAGPMSGMGGGDGLAHVPRRPSWVG